MSRKLKAAVAQMGPIHLADSRASVVKRLMAMLREAHGGGARFVVFPELALTTFFPRWWMTDQAEIDRFFEREMPGPETRPLFELAQRARRRLLPRLCRADRGGRPDPALQHLDPGRARRAHHRPLPQDPSARPLRASAERAVSASRKALLRRRQRGLQGLARVRRGRRHVHLQRPALARDLPRHGAAGRRDRGARLQHADRKTSIIREPVHLRMFHHLLTHAGRTPIRTAPGCWRRRNAARRTGSA